MTWIAFREKQVNGFHREDYFLANIAKVIHQANSKDPEKVTIDPYMLKFTNEPKEKKKELTHQEKLERSLRSKAFWLNTLGIKNVNTNSGNVNSPSND